MIRKRFLHGFLAAALLLTSISWPTTTAKAAESTLEDGLKAYYTFDNTLEDSVGNITASTGKHTGSAVQITNATPVYESGKSGQAIKIGDYGVKLNQEQLGKTYTLSLWVKPTQNMASNQNTLYLGKQTSTDELWTSIAGAGSGNYKLWANGGGYGWTQFTTFALTANEWSHLTLVGTDGKLALYLNGEIVGTYGSNNTLDGSDSDIYLGTNCWDSEFVGLMDEVRIYSRALSASEVAKLYDSRTTQEILESEGFQLSCDSTMRTDTTQTLEVTLPSAVSQDDVVITYESTNPSAVTVDNSGKLTAAGKGTAEIKVTVAAENVSKTESVQVTVGGSISDFLVASFNFDNETLENAVSGGTDASAVELDSTIKDYSNVKYATGKSGRSVSLKKYGLKLNQTNLGQEYTLSFWMKSNVDLATNQVALYMGRNSKTSERWLALSGSSGRTYKFWGNGGIFSTHTTLFSPTIAAKEWTQMTIVGRSGKVTVYQDGICLGTANSNDPLDGTDRDIYLGVNLWDEEFDGMIDEVNVYSVAMTDDEVKAQNADAFSDNLGQTLKSVLLWNDVKGNNQSADEVKSDLVLPTSKDGYTFSWSSDHPEVIAADGTVTIPETDTTVVLTATTTVDSITATRTFTVTVKAVDRTALDALLVEANALDTNGLSTQDLLYLQGAIAAAENAKTFDEVDTAYTDLSKALAEVGYTDAYKNPFAYIDAPEVMTYDMPNESEVLFEISEEVEKAVTVTYSSENEDVATYEDGTLTAVAEGRTIVTAKVRSNYDGYEVEYSTAVSVDKIILLNGANGVWVSDSANASEGLGFEISADYDTYKEDLTVLVDGNEVDPSDYELTKGSIIATLSESYLSGLAKGVHTLEIDVTENDVLVGKVETTFTIASSEPIVSGADSSWTEGSSNASDGVSITIEKDLADYDVKVLVDGSVVDPANYTLKEGSLIVTLSESYLASLKAGTHTLTIDGYNNGVLEWEAETTFTTTKQLAAAEKTPSTIKDNALTSAIAQTTSTSSHKKHSSGSTDSTGTTASSEVTSALNAETGDSTNVLIPVLLLLAACAGIGFVLYRRRKQVK